MICVFDVIEGPARGKRFWLRENQRIAVGRISTADFSVPADPHMSRHHLIFEASPKILRVRDVGSANGTYVNNSRVTKLELCPGDHIRAGSTTFEVTLLGDDQDPHGRDGIPLDSLRSGGQLSSSASFSSSASISSSGLMPAAGLVPNSTAGSLSQAQPVASAAVPAAGQAGVPANAPMSAPLATNNAAMTNMVPTLKFEDEAQRTGSASITSSDFTAAPNALPENQRATAPVHVAVRVLQYEPAALPPVAPPKPEPGNSMPDATDDVLTMRADPAWWAPYFQLSATPFVLEQRPGVKLDLTEVLKRAQSSSPLALVVNHSQLNAAALQFYTSAINPKLITRLSQSLSLLQCDDSDNLWNFVRMSARHDAIICLAARNSFEASWLVELLNCLSYPRCSAAWQKPASPTLPSACSSTRCSPSMKRTALANLV